MGGYDTFFGGNMLQWLRFANSLRLRYAMQMVEVDPTNADPIIGEVVGNNLPVIQDGLNNTGDVGMWPASLNNYDNRVPFRSFYSHKFERMTTAFWNMVSDATNPYQQSGRTDPNNKDGCVFSPFNFHLVCDEGYIPEVLFSAAEVHFLKAEAYLRGLGVPQNEAAADTEYYAGISKIGGNGTNIKMWWMK